MFMQNLINLSAAVHVILWWYRNRQTKKTLSNWKQHCRHTADSNNNNNSIKDNLQGAVTAVAL